MESADKIKKIIDKKTSIEKSYQPVFAFGSFASAVEEANQQSEITDDYLLDIYRRCDAVRISVQSISKAVVYSGGYHFKTRQMKEVDDFNLAVMENFCEDVNEEDVLDDILYDISMYLLIFGRAYIEKVVDPRFVLDFQNRLKSKKGDPDDIKIPYKLYTISPDTIKPLIDKDTGKIRGFRQRILTKKIRDFLPDEIIYIKLPSPIEQIYGLAPDSIIDPIAPYLSANNYNSEFFKNSATPRLHIDFPNGGPEDVKRFTDYANKELKGQPHKNIVTTGGAIIKPISISNTDMEFSKYSAKLTQSVFGLYNMMPFIAGIIETGSTPEQQVAVFKSLAVKPIQKIISNRFNKKLFRTDFKNTNLRLVFNPIDSLDLQFNSKIEESDLKNMVRVVNEIRAERGLGPVDWGERPILPWSDASKATLPKQNEEKND